MTKRRADDPEDVDMSKLRNGNGRRIVISASLLVPLLGFAGKLVSDRVGTVETRVEKVDTQTLTNANRLTIIESSRFTRQDGEKIMDALHSLDTATAELKSEVRALRRDLDRR